MKHNSRRVRITWAAVLFWIAALVGSYPVTGARNLSDWSIPVELSITVNSEFEEFSPDMTKNSLSLYVTPAPGDSAVKSSRSPGVPVVITTGEARPLRARGVTSARPIERRAARGWTAYGAG
jgi:hypothetical protein